MPGVNVYLPEDLHAQVKELGLSVAPICQKALREEISRMETARMEAAGGIESVAARLRKTRDESVRESHERGRKAGTTWAQTWATWDELEGIDELGIVDGYTIDEPFGIDEDEMFFSIARSDLIADDWFGITCFYLDTTTPEWDGFVEGAVAVREAARDLID